MVRFILSFLLLSTCCKGQTPSVITANHIRIDHVGPIDKPIIPLIISTEKLTLPITELPIQVGENTFTLLSNYFKNSKYLNLERQVNEFGVFKITMLVDGKTRISFTPTRQESILLFKNLIDQLKNKEPSEKLLKEINRILARIDFDSK